MNAIFVAGTDTGVGKTLVTGLLGRYLLSKGYTAVTQKWVQTGLFSDIDAHLKLMGKRRSDFGGHIVSMSPYNFGFESSPHLAASLEGRRIETDNIRKKLNVLSGSFDFVIVEGTGGLLVPLNGKTLLIDVVKGLRLPVVIVAGNRLGAINHTLLSAEALISRDIAVLGVIFNDISGKTCRRISSDNAWITEKFTDIPILGMLPASKDYRYLRKKFTVIGDKIMKRFYLEA